MTIISRWSVSNGITANNAGVVHARLVNNAIIPVGAHCTITKFLLQTPGGASVQAAFEQGGSAISYWANTFLSRFYNINSEIPNLIDDVGIKIPNGGGSFLNLNLQLASGADQDLTYAVEGYIEDTANLAPSPILTFLGGGAVQGVQFGNYWAASALCTVDAPTVDVVQAPAGFRFVIDEHHAAGSKLGTAGVTVNTAALGVGGGFGTTPLLMSYGVGMTVPFFSRPYGFRAPVDTTFPSKVEVAVTGLAALDEIYVNLIGHVETV